MKLKMIGTGALSVKERSACCLIDNRILIDCGNGIVKTLMEQNVEINDIDTLLITHLHGDHFEDIPYLIMQRKFTSAQNELNIYCPKGTEKSIGNLISLIYADISDWTVKRDEAKVKFIEFNALNNEEVTRGYYVTSYNVVHGNFSPSYGFVIKNEDKSIGVSGDTIYCDGVDQIVQNSDIAVLDMSFVKGNASHMGVGEIEILSHKYKKTIIPTHMSSPARQYMLENKIDNVIIANDGDEFDI